MFDSVARAESPPRDAVSRHVRDYQRRSLGRPAVRRQLSRRCRWRGPSLWWRRADTRCLQNAIQTSSCAQIPQPDIYYAAPALRLQVWAGCRQPRSPLPCSDNACIERHHALPANAGQRRRARTACTAGQQRSVRDSPGPCLLRRRTTAAVNRDPSLLRRLPTPPQLATQTEHNIGQPAVEPRAHRPQAAAVQKGRAYRLIQRVAFERCALN